MNTPATNENSGTAPQKSKWRISGLLQSSILFSAASFLIGIGNMLFQVVIGHQLPRSTGEYGLVQTTLSFVGFLSLPLPAAINAVTHYIARFHYEKNHERLHHLLVGCRRFLFYLTVGGSVAAILLIKPLSVFFNFPSANLMLVALICVLAGLWSSFATALCQGLAWFKRLALLGLLAVALRILFTWVTTKIWPTAELAVLASAVMLLAYLIVLFWKDEFPRQDAAGESPWTPEFIQFLIVCVAFSVGAYCFTQGDLLIVQRYFLKGDRDTYSAAGMLTRNLPTTVAPMLVVLFTHRSGRHHGDAMRDQLKLLALYAAGLIGSAIALFVLRDFCLKIIFGKVDPECAAMVGRLAPAMVFVGLLQALGTWSLASHWIKLALFYCGLGVAYWLALFFFGRSPDDLLRLIPVAAGISFGLLLLFWLITLRTYPTKSNSVEEL